VYWYIGKFSFCHTVSLLLRMRESTALAHHQYISLTKWLFEADRQRSTQPVKRALAFATARGLTQKAIGYLPGGVINSPLQAFTPCRPWTPDRVRGDRKEEVRNEKQETRCIVTPAQAGVHSPKCQYFPSSDRSTSPVHTLGYNTSQWNSKLI